MKKLEKDFDFKGFHYHEEWRNEDFAIYSQWLEGELIGYESIKIRKQKAQLIFGKESEAKEVYPSDNYWGKYGFTSKTFAEAENMLLKHFNIASNLQNLVSDTLVETLSLSRSEIVR